MTWCGQTLMTLMVGLSHLEVLDGSSAPKSLMRYVNYPCYILFTGKTALSKARIMALPGHGLFRNQLISAAGDAIHGYRVIMVGCPIG